MLRTTHSTGIIFIAFTSDSRSFSSETKCVGMPAAASLPMTNALIRLFVSPLRSSLRELGAVERRHVVAVVHDEPLRIVGRVDGLRLAAIELLPLFHAVFSVESSRQRYISRQPKPSA